MSRKEDLEYIKDLSRGNHEAYDYLFLQYYPRVIYFIQHLTKSHEVAKDLSQDIFEKIWKNRSQISEVDSFNSYVFRMAKNSALNYLEHLQTVSEYENNYQYDKNSLSTEEEIEAKDLEMLIQLVVDNMPPQRQKIFKLSRELHLKNKEIAVQLGISEKTVKNHLTLALNEIRDAILVAFIIFFHSN